MTKQDMCRGLREFADWIEENGDFLTDHGDMNDPGWNFNMCALERDTLAQYARVLGKAEKGVEGDWFKVTRKFGPIIAYAFASREKVCTKVVTGTREVTETVRDPEMLERVPLVERTRTEEIVEWQCDPSLLSDRAA